MMRQVQQFGSEYSTVFLISQCTSVTPLGRNRDCLINFGEDSEAAETSIDGHASMHVFWPQIRSREAIFHTRAARLRREGTLLDLCYP